MTPGVVVSKSSRRKCLFPPTPAQVACALQQDPSCDGWLCKAEPIQDSPSVILHALPLADSTTSTPTRTSLASKDSPTSMKGFSSSCKRERDDSPSAASCIELPWWQCPLCDFAVHFADDPHPHSKSSNAKSRFRTNHIRDVHPERLATDQIFALPKRILCATPLTLAGRRR